MEDRKFYSVNLEDKDDFYQWFSASIYLNGNLKNKLYAVNRWYDLGKQCLSFNITGGKNGREVFNNEFEAEFNLEVGLYFSEYRNDDDLGPDNDEDDEDDNLSVGHILEAPITKEDYDNAVAQADEVMAAAERADDLYITFRQFKKKYFTPK